MLNHRNIKTGKDVEPLVKGLLGTQATEGALEIWAVDSDLGGETSASSASTNQHEWQTLCVWGGATSGAHCLHHPNPHIQSNCDVPLCAKCTAGPCSGMGGSDSWQIMVQMLRVAGAERLLPKATSPPRPPIFQRTLNFVIALAHNMDYGFHPSYSMDYANASSIGEPATA